MRLRQIKLFCWNFWGINNPQKFYSSFRKNDHDGKYHSENISVFKTLDKFSSVPILAQPQPKTWQAGTKRSAVTASTCRKTERSPSILRIFWQFHAITALRFVHACHNEKMEVLHHY
jgi:hypothetical protein